MSDEPIEEILSPEIANLESMTNSEIIMTMSSDEAIDSNVLEVLQQQSIRQPVAPITTSRTSKIEEDDDFVEDETILERIIALKEMFPESIRNTVCSVNSAIIETSKFAYTKGRIATWWITSTMCVLVFPILIQKELLQVAEQISQEQRSILLGPQAAIGGSSGGVF